MIRALLTIVSICAFPFALRADLPISLVLMDADAPAKAVITDQRGLPLPVSSPFGRMLVFSAKDSIHGDGPQAITWTVEPPEMDARKWAPNPEEFSISPEPLDANNTPYVLRVFLSVAKNNTVSQLTISVRCGEGDIPPPVPPGPKPGPETPIEATARIAINTYAANISKAFGDASNAKHAEAAKANAALGAANKAARESAFVPVDHLIDSQIGGIRWEPTKAAVLFGELSAAFGKAAK